MPSSSPTPTLCLPRLGFSSCARCPWRRHSSTPTGAAHYGAIGCSREALAHDSIRTNRAKACEGTRRPVVWRTTASLFSFGPPTTLHRQCRLDPTSSPITRIPDTLTPHTKRRTHLQPRARRTLGQEQHSRKDERESCRPRPRRGRGGARAFTRRDRRQPRGRRCDEHQGCQRLATRRSVVRFTTILTGRHHAAPVRTGQRATQLRRVEAQRRTAAAFRDRNQTCATTVD